MRKVIGFTGARKFTYTLSLVLIVGMFVITFLRGGYNLGTDFEPGISVEVKIDQSVSAPIEELRSTLKGFSNLEIQDFGGAGVQEYKIRVRAYQDRPGYADEVQNQMKAELGKVFGADKVSILQSTSISPRFSQTLVTNAVWLVALSLAIILIYVWIRFRFGFALAAIIATIHDTLFVVAFIGATRMEFTSTTIAAVLTIIGYSLNDTIVVFDRIRENEKLMADQKLSTIYDTSITITLARTIITSLTVFLAVLSIFVFTQGDIRDFATVMMVGVIVGTYSSIFIASPILLDWRTAQNKRRRIREAKVGGKPLDAAAAAVDGSAPENDIDADALADEIRRQRQEKKKF